MFVGGGGSLLLNCHFYQLEPLRNSRTMYASGALRETIMQKRLNAVRTVIGLLGLLFIGSGWMLGQTSQPPASQNTPVYAPQANVGGQQAGISDQDIAMLRADLRSKRKQITAQNMNLTTEEATKFWPVYDQYVLATIKQNDARWAMIKDYAANYSGMTDEQ